MTGLTLSSPADAAEVDARDEFRTLYAELFPGLFGYAYQLLRDEEVARDVAQEAFTELLSRWVTVREPRPYLFRIVTHLARDAWKSHGRQRRLLSRLVDRDPSVAGPDSSVADAVRRLPSRYREIVLLFYYADLPLCEVARAVRRPEGSVKRLLSEARVRLARSLGDSRD